jgi:carbon storage regulator
MLVLSRHEKEKIYIGQDIVITVVEIDRGKVRLGFDAPSGVSILRSELIGEEAQRKVNVHGDRPKG